MSLISFAKLRVLIVEDHSLLIDGLRNLLAAQGRYEVVGEVTDGLQVYEACQRLEPDLILLDLSLPGMDGIDVIHQLHKRWETLRIVVVTASNEEHRGRAALAAGALAYVLKQSPQQVLLAALQHAVLGKAFIDPALKLDSIAEPEVAAGEAALTLRERQVLKLVAEGKRNRDVAELLSISLKTVETHRLNLMRKLDAHNAAELSSWARRLGLTEF
ncbi:two component system response regulator [Chitinimonas sp. BJB300]|uniref:two component system response regulator n=1 Tax=Chitinimonas sp. BJB300 TaxID=1559339 RepID=UPI000C0C8F95|nr:two component system response regulator [Chitinimonas sp. BJB300]PHV11490.1 DNA-binding response regulator [Chitinimonas sp. BJB300]TSJ88514.1 two component system response regulator [Chitinimonas sp. BJB300]